MNLDKKIIYISDNDLDGVVSALFLYDTYKNGEVNLSETRNLDNELIGIINGKKFDKVYITDTHPKKQETIDYIENLIKNGTEVVLIDHHDTAKALNEKEWATVVSEKNGVKQCGATLVLDYLEEQGFNVDKYRKLSLITRAYDTWDLSDDNYRNGDILSKLFTIKDKYEIFDKLKKYLNTGILITDEDKTSYDVIKSIQQKYIDSIIDKAYITNWKGYKIGITTSNMFGLQYIVLEELMKKDNSLDFCINVDTSSKIVSFKTLNNTQKYINVGNIAKLNGGGGQEIIGGFHLNMDFIFELVLDNIKF